jgi:hypothetical protein
MDRPYVGIRKNHTDQIKMDKKVHLGKMDFFVQTALVQPIYRWQLCTVAGR